MTLPWRQRLLDLAAVDLRALALMRVALGSVLLINLLLWLGDLGAFYTDDGVMPRPWLIQSDSVWRWSLHLASGGLWWALLLHAVLVLAALAMIFGYFGRIAVAVLFLLMVSLQNRDPMVLIGGDSLIMCLLFWLLFLPVSARWSVDAALAREPAFPQHRYASAASLGLLLQVMSVYFFSAILKDSAVWFPDGTAVYYTMELERYATPLGRVLADYPRLMQGLSYYVWFLEWSAPVLVFLPLATQWLRLAMMALLMAMHLGFILCMEIGHFPYVSLASLTILAGSPLWQGLARLLDHGRALRIYYDRDCGFCWKSVQLMRVLLILPRCEIAPAQDSPRSRALMDAHWSWVVIDDADEAHLKWPAFVAVLRHSLLLRPLAALAARPFWVAPGNRVYDWVAAHRGGFGRLSAALLPARQTLRRPGRVTDAVAAAFIGLVLAWNLTTVKALPVGVIDSLRPTFRLLRIDQFWNMFAPYPSRADGWVVFPGTLEDGSQVDVLRPDQPLDWSKPRYISHTHENVRWHTYRWRLWEQTYAGNRLWYGRYLCRQWNREAVPGKRLVSFKMVWVQEFTPPPGSAPPQPEQGIGWHHQCVPAELLESRTEPERQPAADTLP